MKIGTQNLTLDQWSAKSGLKRSTIANRIARAWTPRQAVGLDHRPQGITGPKTNASRQTGYMAAKNQQRRETAKRLGMCVECVVTEAKPSHARCPDCLRIDRFRASQRYQKAA